MFFRKVTIFVVPDGTKKVKQFKIPKLFLSLFVLLSIVCSAFLFSIVQDYYIIKSSLPRLSELKRENVQQKRQCTYLAQRINQITKRMVELNEFDRKLKTMVNLKTGEDDTQFKGVGGSDPILLDPKHAIAKTHGAVVRSMHRALDNLDNEITFGKEDKAGLYKFLENQKMLLASTPSIRPAKGWMSSGFGHRVSPFTGQKEFHRGIDLATRMGAPIVAPADGMISSITWDHGYGRVLTINHGYGVSTKYAHLKKALVKKGQYVKRGETIALVG
ncbi:MAG: M23 family metallopeptidase, partial [Desulfobacterales bacterium]|nr:M23 family metallopeptidase [Desulfobacterales bacterium]